MQTSCTISRLQHFALTVVIILVFVPGLQLYGQSNLWATLIEQGNAALSAGNLAAAQNYYAQARDLTGYSVATDLAQYTTQRNIAQAFVQSASLEYADSIYSLIIPRVSAILVTSHPYRLNLLAEQAAIREAIRLSAIIPERPVIGLSFWERLEKWWVHCAVYTRLRAGPTSPMGGEFSTSHTNAMSFDLFFKSPWLELGSMPVDLGIRRTFVRFEGKHKSTGPITITGLDITVNPLLGRLYLSGGGGIYNVYHGGEKGSLPGVSAGAGWVILRNRHPEQQRIFLEVSGHYTLLLGEVPATSESLMFINLGANIGYRW